MAVSPEALEKARKVRLLIMDVDGVLTDGRVLFGPDGSQSVFFNVQDGSGVKYLRRAGIRIAILTGRHTEAVAARARMLGIEEVVQGAKVKLEGYESIRRRAELADAQIAYVGDDLPDLPVLRRAGLAVAVADAAPEVIEAADLVTQAQGGRGAVRELAEFLLKAQDQWGRIMARYEP